MDNVDFAHAERSALEQFRRRIAEITTEVEAIDRELARRDILALAHRTRRSIRATRGLLDRNVDVLFAGQQEPLHGDLYAELKYADNHVAEALSTEVEFQLMEQRLYLAARLVEDVLAHVLLALQTIQERMDGEPIAGKTPM